MRDLGPDARRTREQALRALRQAASTTPRSADAERHLGLLLELATRSIVLEVSCTQAAAAPPGGPRDGEREAHVAFLVRVLDALGRPPRHPAREAAEAIAAGSPSAMLALATVSESASRARLARAALELLDDDPPPSDDRHLALELSARAAAALPSEEAGPLVDRVLDAVGPLAGPAVDRVARELALLGPELRAMVFDRLAGLPVAARCAVLAQLLETPGPGEHRHLLVARAMAEIEASCPITDLPSALFEALWKLAAQLTDDEQRTLAARSPSCATVVARAHEAREREWAAWQAPIRATTTRSFPKGYWTLAGRVRDGAAAHVVMDEAKRHDLGHAWLYPLPLVARDPTSLARAIWNEQRSLLLEGPIDDEALFRAITLARWLAAPDVLLLLTRMLERLAARRSRIDLLAGDDGRNLASVLPMIERVAGAEGVTRTARAVGEATRAMR